MEYFTVDWLRGRLSDGEYEDVPRRYAARIRELLPTLPAPVAKLATEVNLHDALVRRVVLDRPDLVLVLELVAGDRQRGYSDVELTYSGVDLAVLNLEDLSAMARDRRSELVADEVDRLDDGRFEHRVLFTLDAEIDIVFNRLEVSSRPRRDRALPFLGDPFVELFEGNH